MNLYKYHTNPDVLKHSDKPREHVVPSETVAKLRDGATAGKRVDPEVEQLAIKHAVNQLESGLTGEEDFYILDVIINYANNVFDGRWPEFERVLLQRTKEQKIDIDYFGAYIDEIKGDWPEGRQLLRDLAAKGDQEAAATLRSLHGKI
jgi:hypothetical protein